MYDDLPSPCKTYLGLLPFHDKPTLLYYHFLESATAIYPADQRLPDENSTAFRPANHLGEFGQHRVEGLGFRASVRVPTGMYGSLWVLQLLGKAIVLSIPYDYCD